MIHNRAIIIKHYGAGGRQHLLQPVQGIRLCSRIIMKLDPVPAPCTESDPSGSKASIWTREHANCWKATCSSLLDTGPGKDSVQDSTCQGSKPTEDNEGFINQRASTQYTATSEGKLRLHTWGRDPQNRRGSLPAPCLTEGWKWAMALNTEFSGEET